MNKEKTEDKIQTKILRWETNGQEVTDKDDD